MACITFSICSDKSCNSSRSGPDTLMPTGVLMPVDSISIRVLIGMVQALVSPGKRIAWSICAISSWVVLLGSGHSDLGFRLMVVSIIDRGAGSVAVSARPILPNTCATSGKVIRILSVCCNNSLALVIEMPGNVLGIYRISPSSKGGMNSLPILDSG